MTNYEKLCEVAQVKSKIKKTLIDDVVYPLPSFTAEKQIEIIKLIAKPLICVINLSPNGNYIITAEDFNETENQNFTEALAGLTLKLIEAGELDKDEVRKVLE